VRTNVVWFDLAHHYEELAYHFAQGEDWAQAMHYSTFAGDRATHAFANAEASQHYARALQAEDKALPPPDPEHLASLHAKHGAVLNILAEYESAFAEYQQALG
jgi:hypothetical protein